MSRPGPGLAPGALAARRLGVFGGSFDPPHIGHLRMAGEARAARSLDHVLWVPAAQPPHKPGRRLAPAQARVRMLELLLAGEPEGQDSIWTVELERRGTSFTIDTLRELRRRLGDDPPELFLILGEDNVPGFPGWRAAAEIVGLAQPVVLPRGPVSDPEEAPPSAQPGADGARGAHDDIARRLHAARVHCTTIEVSSTELRRRLAAGRPLGERVPGPLGDYLVASGVYAAS